MNWFRDSKLIIFLGFWLLWSTAGITLYLEYCTCAGDLHTSIFESDSDGWCSDEVYAVDLNGHNSEGEKATGCCSSVEEKTKCPPKGCDSQDTREYKVQSPYIPSSFDWDLTWEITNFTGLYNFTQLEKTYEEEHVYNFSYPFEKARSSLQTCILLQSFLC